MVSFRGVFGEGKAVIGMIHLAGALSKDKVERALEEIRIYEEEGLQGAIFEDYHGTMEDVESALIEISREGVGIQLGVNILNETSFSFGLADTYGASFVQLDGMPTDEFDLRGYQEMRESYPNIAVIGGVRFKHTSKTGNPLRYDLERAMLRCEAICTTGPSTGVETPIVKLENFREIMGDFPLVVGAGVTVLLYNLQLLSDRTFYFA